ncbi:thermonuclease family protein [Candidatus Nanohalobium constans]|uniref:Micrococcal nuclease n=1 Tax=Candidatus Nanohalobium constans TaxID=2565781 RepID=A0A5Q0UH09_9ARCH|nr:thermonuclease family protein [Candidatus Nanohalobium constans]QGA80651.1 micrococcal nuclease [Candidatus Nanohalobium constans]
MNQQTIITTLLITAFTISAVTTATDINSGKTKQANITAKTVEVIDGDTVDIQNNGKDTVRVLGIDTPEISGQNIPKEYFLENTSKSRKCLREMGEKASEFAQEKLADREIQVATDSEADRRGAYGRLLAYLEYNGSDLGQELLKKGYARVYNSSFERKEKYRELGTESRREGKGIWNESCGV